MPRCRHTSLLALSGALATAAHAQAPALSATQPAADADEIVVTGVVTGAQSVPSIAVSVLRDDQLRQLVPVSAADLLRQVPGVFVNSALGEVRNIVYSRGVSANSAEAATGYYYVSLQEDGLPVTNVTATNYSPDFFFRQDINVGRLEALRGGTAVVTGPNAPGGIFNYISRTGRSNEGVELSARAGLLGDGRNPYYRADAYAGGKFSDNLFYAIGGFYRWDRGARDPGYAFNRGGQVKGNLLFDNGTTSAMLYGKLLDDRNAFYEFLPATNFDDPTIIPPLSVYDSFLPPATRYSYTPFQGAAARTWDSTDLTHSRSRDIGLKLSHDFGGGWSLDNNFKYAFNKVTYNTGAVIFPLPVSDIVLNAFLGTLAPGTYTFRDRATGATALQFSRAGFAFPPAITVNNLPNQNVVANGVISQVAYDVEQTSKEIMNQFALTKRLETMTFRVGAFFAQSDWTQLSGTAGIGVAPIQGRPQLFDITFQAPGGPVQQVTSPQGYAGIGRTLGGTQADLRQRQVSAFAGHNWNLTDALSSDIGVRYESIKVSGTTRLSTTAGVAQAPGGVDGNANTLFDNVTAGLTAPLAQRNTLDFLSVSGALTYKLGPRNSVFARYSSGKKAPDLGFFLTLTSPGAVASLRPLPQKVTQVELGFRHRSPGVALSINPFYSRLSNVPSQQLFTNADGSTYVPAPLFSSLRTIGVEVEGNFDLAPALNLNIAATFQDSKSKGFRTYVANAPGPADDTIASVPDGEADNNPRVMSTTTLRWTPVERFTTFVGWKYLGARQANRFNTWKLPAFSQFDVGAAFDVTPNIQLNANINNALNSKGVFSWGPAGGLLASLDRQNFTPAQLAANPGQQFNVITVQPRAMFVGATVKF